MCLGVVHYSNILNSEYLFNKSEEKGHQMYQNGTLNLFNTS